MRDVIRMCIVRKQDEIVRDVTSMKGPRAARESKCLRDCSHYCTSGKCKSDYVILPLKDETFFSRNNVCHAIHNVALPVYTRLTCAALRANPPLTFLGRHS